jgi:hypothetical protein
MTDLLNQARNNSASGTKKSWTMEATLALIILKGQGKTTKQIAALVGHPENSVVYRFNRWCNKFTNFAEILEHYGIADKSVEDVEQIVNDYLESKTES